MVVPWCRFSEGFPAPGDMVRRRTAPASQWNGQPAEGAPFRRPWPPSGHTSRGAASAYPALKEKALNHLIRRALTVPIAGVLLLLGPAWAGAASQTVVYGFGSAQGWHHRS